MLEIHSGEFLAGKLMRYDIYQRINYCGCRIYTGGENAEFIFALGPQDAVYLAKFDAKTLELLQKVEFGELIKF